MVLLAMVAAYMIHCQKMDMSSLKIVSVFVIYLSALSGNLITIGLSGEKRLINCSIHVGAIALFCLVCSTLIGDGVSSDFGMGVIMIIAAAFSSLGICALSPRKKKNIKTRYC